MSLVNGLLRPLFDVALRPFAAWSPLVGLTVISLLTSVGLLIVFKHTSNQKALERVKRKIHAGLFEIRLFNDDLRAIMKALFGILRHNLTYLRYSTAPMLWTLPPLVLVIAQLQFHYGYEGLRLGEPTLVKAHVKEGAFGGEAKPEVALRAPAGIAVDGPPVWIPSLGEMAWRVVPEAPGDYELEIELDGSTVAKSVLVSEGQARRSPVRVRGFLDELLYPAEPPLPGDAPFESVSIDYPETDVEVFGLGMHWIIVYFALSLVFAFLLRGPFKVTI